VRWRKKFWPKVQPALQVNSIQSVIDAVEAGLGVGIGPCFLAQSRAGLTMIEGPLAECETQLWLLTHPESRHLRRIAAVSAHLVASLALD
jgi:DNA-binding transcriptional LysR family regulator